MAIAVQGVVRLSLVTILLTGCAASTAPAARITAFSDAVSLSMQNTKSAFDVVEQRYGEVLALRAVARYDTRGFDPKAFYRFLSPEEMAARLLVIEGLKRYAETLAAIMSDDQLKEFDKQTKQLGDALKGVNADLVKTKLLSKTSVDATQINIFTTAVNALGRWFIDYKREKGVRQAIEEMHPHVVQICALLDADLGTSPLDVKPGERATGLRGQLWDEYSEALRLQDEFISHAKPPLDPIAKRTEIRQLVTLTLQRQEADATLKAMQKALTTLRATHAKLGDAFAKQPIELEHLVSDLIDEGKRIKDFYDKLGK